MRPIKCLRFYVAAQEVWFHTSKASWLIPQWPRYETCLEASGTDYLFPTGRTKTSCLWRDVFLDPCMVEGGEPFCHYSGSVALACLEAVWPKLKSLQCKFGEPRSVFGTATGLLVDLGQLFTFLYFGFFPNKHKLFLPTQVGSHMR